MLTVENIKDKIPSLSTSSNDDVNALLEQAKGSTLALRSILKLTVIIICGLLYLLAKGYLLNKGYSRFVSFIGSVFIIASAFYLVAFIDEKILVASINSKL